MGKYRILIIDDDRIRRQTYETLFGGEYELDYIFSPDEAEKAVFENYDAIVLDIQLWEGYQLKDFLDKIGRKRPVILASSHWGEPAVDAHLDRIVRNISSYNIIYHLVFETLHSLGKRTADLLGIRFALDKIYRRAQFYPAPDDVITLLHVSDPQYGDKHESGAYLANLDITNALQKECIKPHFIVVTGDISATGHPEEFDEAYAEISELVSNLWPEDPTSPERIFVVPGIHDVDLALQAADCYKYDFKKKDFVDLDSKKPGKHTQFGLTPFREFAFRLTNDQKWRTSENLCWINKSFQHIGLRFVQLSSVNYLSFSSPSRAIFDKDILKRLAGNLQQGSTEQMFTIAICHHGPPYINDEGEAEVILEEPAEFQHFLSRGNINLLLHGHGHQWKADTLIGKEPHIIRCMAPTTHLAHVLRPPEERRGFNVISLERISGIIKQVKVQCFSFSKDSKEIVLRETITVPLDTESSN